MRTETIGAVAPGARAARSRRKFQRFYPGGFQDPDYVELERDYKWEAHERWNAELGKVEMQRLLRDGEFVEAAQRAVRIESRTNLLFSFEKMALRDAVKTTRGAKLFAEGLYELLHGSGSMPRRFERWIEAVASLPRKQTRVLTWPLVTVFPFLAQPDVHVFLKPKTTKRAAEVYGFDFHYQSRPSFAVYAGLLTFASLLERDLADWHPRDRIDIQGFIWVLGSDEYA